MPISTIKPRKLTGKSNPTSSPHPTENNRKGNIENLRPWQKGQSGNPGGRPKTLPVTTALRLMLEEKQLPKRAHPDMTVAERIALRLARKAIKEDKAAVEVMDRVEGKARQRTELSGPNGGAMQFDIPADRAALELRIAELLKK